jgi:hypothetical protein
MKTYVAAPSASAERTYLTIVCVFALIAAVLLGFALFGFWAAFHGLIAWLFTRG